MPPSTASIISITPTPSCVLRHVGADIRKGFVDIGRDGFHPSRRGQRDQGHSQGVFDMILAMIFAEKLQPDIELPKFVDHVIPSLHSV